jgi:hypothetical protein
MPTIKEAVTDLRKQRFTGQQPQHAFVSGDVSPGTVREQQPETEVQSDTDCDPAENRPE